MNCYGLIVIAMLSGVHSFIVCSGDETQPKRFSCKKLATTVQPWESPTIPSDKPMKNLRTILDGVLHNNPSVFTDKSYVNITCLHEACLCIAGTLDKERNMQSINVIIAPKGGNEAVLVASSDLMEKTVLFEYPSKGEKFVTLHDESLGDSLTQAALLLKERFKTFSRSPCLSEGASNYFGAHTKISEEDLSRATENFLDPFYCPDDLCENFLPCSDHSISGPE